MAFFRKARASIALWRRVDEQLYEQALDEFEAGIVRRGLWAKALSDANGDESLAKGIYLKLRVRSMGDDAAVVDSLLEGANDPVRESESEESVGFGNNPISQATQSDNKGPSAIVILGIVGVLILLGVLLANADWSKSSGLSSQGGDTTPQAVGMARSSGGLLGCEIYTFDGVQFFRGTKPASDYRSYVLSSGGMQFVLSMPLAMAAAYEMHRHDSPSPSPRFTNFLNEKVLPEAQRICGF